jgi:hypothetical protein
MCTKLDSLVASLHSQITENNLATNRDVREQLNTIIAEIYNFKHREIVAPPARPGEDPKIIQTEVTVFKSVEHEGGRVHTGWTFPNGASADSPPKLQFCYWSTQPMPDTTAVVDVWIAMNGKQLANIPPNVPNLSGALDKCYWWDGSATQRVESPKQRNPRFQPLGGNDRWGRPL